LIIANWEKVKRATFAIWGSIKRFFSTIWDGILGIFNSTIGKILFGPLHLLIGAYKKITGQWDDGKGFFENLWNGIVETFKAAWRNLKEIGSDIVDFFKFLFTPRKLKIDVEADIKKPKIPPIEDTRSMLTVIDGGMSGLGNKESRVPKGFDFGDTETSSQQQSKPQIVTTAERTARSFEERSLTTTNKSEVTIKDESGRAKVTKGSLGSDVKLQPTGTF